MLYRFSVDPKICPQKPGKKIFSGSGDAMNRIRQGQYPAWLLPELQLREAADSRGHAEEWRAFRHVLEASQRHVSVFFRDFLLLRMSFKGGVSQDLLGVKMVEFYCELQSINPSITQCTYKFSTLIG